MKVNISFFFLTLFRVVFVHSSDHITHHRQKNTPYTFFFSNKVGTSRRKRKKREREGEREKKSVRVLIMLRLFQKTGKQTRR